MPATLLVWDAEGPPPVGGWTTVLWRGFGDSASPYVVSIPKLVELYADILRARFLAWTYELGETRIQGRRLVDYLQLRPGFSYWWMTLFVEKCNYSKSPQIEHAIRLMAFERWATGQSISHVVLGTPNVQLAECMRSWCAKSGLSFEWQHMATDDAERLPWLKKLYQSLPHPVQALTSLALYVFRRWALKGVGLPEWRQTEGRTTFVSYLFNLVPDALKEGRFESRFWAHLPDALQRDGCKTNWLHLYVKDALLPNARRAADVIRQFNTTGQGGQNHVTLDAFLGPGVVFGALRDWFRLGWVGRGMYQALSSARGSAIDLWPLFRDDWYRSLYGQTALSNLLHCNMLESALKSLPEQSVGAYLQENQGWEFAFIHAWKAAGHGRLIGVAHATIRYWDLRYFFDSRSYLRTGGGDLPLPDQVALNGAAALDAAVTGGYPERDLVEVEALRFLHLAEAGAERNSVSRPSAGSLRVLVLGEYLLSNTQKQMRLLEKAAQSLPPDTIVTVKPHPACPVQPGDYPGLRLKVTMDSVSKLLAGCDVAYTSNVTSAAVDAYCAGVPVVSMLDPNTLNLSPLRGREGVLFVSTPEELASALISAASTPRSPEGRHSFFTLDFKLPRWRKLLLEPIG